MTSESLAHLIQQSIRHNAEAFSALVAEYQSLVFRLSFRLLCNEEDAEDAVQDTFLKVWLSINTYDERCKFSTWLYKIACNTCYDKLRKSHTFASVALDNSLQLLSVDDQEQNLDNRQIKDLILKFTSELTPKQRLVFMLRDVEDLSSDEVETITGLSVEEIKRILFAARSRIRKRMGTINR